jgi:hypothetical protein
MLFVIALGVASLQSATATEADSSYYVNADVGLNFERGKVRLVLGPDVLNRVPLNQHAAVWGLSVGERFTRHFALEVGYRDLGSVYGALVNAPGTNSATGSMRFTSSGPTVVAVGIVPFGRWEADFKLGTLIADSHLSLQVTDSRGTSYLHASTWNAGLLTGVSIGYHVSDRWKLSFGETFFDNIGRRDVTGHWNLSATTIEASYRF